MNNVFVQGVLWSDASFVLGRFIDKSPGCIYNKPIDFPAVSRSTRIGSWFMVFNNKRPFWCLLHRERVHVEVEDVNEFDPIWVQRTYYAEASDGQLFSRLVQLQAVDRDGIPGISKICHYQVTTPDVPFEVDADGKSRRNFVISYRMSCW